MGFRATALGARTWEVMAYLNDVRGWRPEGVAITATRTLHAIGVIAGMADASAIGDDA